MNVLTAEWVEKAEGDFATAGRESRARKQPNYDAVCFDAQQAAEKYLKAYLQEHDVPIPRTHSLIELLELVRTFDPGSEPRRSNSIFLDRYAVRYRYPGDSADRKEARQAWSTIRASRTFVRQRLGLPSK